MRKQSIAIFNPQDPLEHKVQELCHKLFNVWLTAQQVQGLIEGIVGYDGLFEHFLRHPEKVLGEILSGQVNNQVCIPCYTLELRQILHRKMILTPYKIAAFGTAFARKFLTDYPVLLVIDSNRLTGAPLVKLQGISVFEQELWLENSVVRILTRERADQETYKQIEKIVKDEYPTATVHVITDVPGIGVPKSAQLETHPKHQRYSVNVSALGVQDVVIRSSSPEKALEEALTEAWRKSGNPHRDPKFTAAFWIQRGMLNQLVQPTDEVFAFAAIEVMNNPEINLTPQEKKIFDFLLGINSKYQLGLTFRVAGGWVRDKALGKESDDIDIALDKMTGAEFGKYITKEIGKTGNVIKANPEQSKHLETMTTNLFGLDVDFVNLRNESYGDSRIPDMQFGDAQTDAERRDLTINSLFYNINTNQVEDFTGKGMEDLKSMTLRTPLDPVKTFMDDPLRILRLLRFYSRYKGSKIDPAALEAMKNPEVQAALKNKVSPERIYTEWGKMFAGSQQTAALRVLHDTGLWNSLFGDQLKGREQKVDDKLVPPANLHPFTMDQNNPWHVDNVLDHTLKVMEKYDAILRADGAGDEERAKALSAAWLHDLGKLDPSIIGVKEDAEKRIRNTYHGHEDVSALVARSILSALKASSEDIHYIEQIVQNHMLPHNDMTDKQIRKLINKLGRDLVKRIVQHAMADADSKPGADLTHYQNLLNRVQTIVPSGEMGSGNLKPVLNGQIIMNMFPNLQPKSGYIREINTRLQDMKDENPAMTEQQAIAAVEAMRGEIESKYGPNATPKGNMKQAQRWYDQMREIGERPNTAAWICGDVVKRLINEGSKSEHEAVMLVNDETEYQLRRSEGNPFRDPWLDKLVGKKICGKGIVHGTTFIMSEYQVTDETPEEGVVYMQRERPEDLTKFQEGDRVRHRQRGLAFEQIDGVVQKIEGPLMYVKWKGINDLEVFNLTDTVALFGLIEKI